MHKLVRLVMALVLAITGTAIVVLLPSGASAAAPPGCKVTWGTNDTSVSVYCGSGHGSRFHITAKACNVSYCVDMSSSNVNYPGTARISVASSAAVTPNSLGIWWATSTGSFCPYSVQSGSVAWCDMQASIQDWAARGIVYNGSWQLNWYKDRNYRPDCSGLVDMAWHLNADPNTDTLPNYSKAVSVKYGTTTAYVHPGDVLDDIVDGHAVIFAGWNSDHVHFSVWSFGFGTMGPGKLFTNQPYSGTSDSGQKGLIVAGKLQSNYHAYRYTNKYGS